MACEVTFKRLASDAVEQLGTALDVSIVGDSGSSGVDVALCPAMSSSQGEGISGMETRFDSECRGAKICSTEVWVGVEGLGVDSVESEGSEFGSGSLTS